MNTTTTVQVLSVTIGQEDLLRIIDPVIDYIASTGCNCQADPLEVTVKGDYEEPLDVVKGVQLICVRQGTGSVKFYVKVFYSPKDHLLTIDKGTKEYR